jgi:FkbM family methyltransferase
MGPQYGEDEIIAKYFSEHRPADWTGFFVDVGAADGATNSNTYFLARDGWSGLLIEPDLSQYQAALKMWTRRHRPDIAVMQAGCGTVEGEKTFYGGAGQASTFDPAFRDACIDRYSLRYSETTVMVMRLDRIMQYFPGKHIDFLSIDCEGMDQDAADSMGDLRPDLICSESPLVRIDDYAQYARTRGNIFYARIKHAQ